MSNVKVAGSVDHEKKGENVRIVNFPDYRNMVFSLKDNDLHDTNTSYSACTVAIENERLFYS